MSDKIIQLPRPESWLEATLRRAAKEVAAWPQWKREAMEREIAESAKLTPRLESYL